MEPQFLCVHHKQLLSANPCMARRYWERCMQEGQALMTRSHYRTALPHFGSGFEIAMILLANDCQPVQVQGGGYADVDRLVDAGHGTAACYRQLGQFHLEKNYLLTTYYAVLEAGEFVRGDQSAIYREAISRALEKISEASLAGYGLPGGDPTQSHVLSRAMH